jgi:hypothetical protein
MRVLNNQRQWVGDGQIVDRHCDCIEHQRLGPRHDEPTAEEIKERADALVKIVEAARTALQKENQMHYRNGREAKNGDKVVKLEGGKVTAFGVLHSATPGNDYCNGNIAVIQAANDYACMVDCLHVDDVADILTEKGLDKRPSGK